MYYNWDYNQGYYCGYCGQWVYYNVAHCCYQPEQCSGTYYSELKHYKCPNCNGEFSKPSQKFTGKYKEVDIQEIGNTNIVISKHKTPIYKYICPFCNKEMKGLNQ